VEEEGTRGRREKKGGGEGEQGGEVRREGEGM